MSAPFGKQNCFMYQGEGKIWPFQNKSGIPKKCSACKDNKYIDSYLQRCPHCQGTNKIYENEQRIGIPKDCKFCKKNGYIDFMVTPWIECEQTGKIWPFEHRHCIPKDCKKCKGYGFISGEKLSPMGPPQGNYPNYSPPSQISYSSPFGKQNCFICKGEGKIWPFKGKKVLPKNDLFVKVVSL